MNINATAQSLLAWTEDWALLGERAPPEGWSERLPSPLHFNTNAKNPSSQAPQASIS